MDAKTYRDNASLYHKRRIQEIEDKHTAYAATLPIRVKNFYDSIHEWVDIASTRGELQIAVSLSQYDKDVVQNVASMLQKDGFEIWFSRADNPITSEMFVAW